MAEKKILKNQRIPMIHTYTQLHRSTHSSLHATTLRHTPNPIHTQIQVYIVIRNQRETYTRLHANVQKHKNSNT